MRFRLSEESDGFGTRIKGERLRTVMEERMHSLAPHEQIEIDFKGVDYMTPSFADECFGKLVEELGADEFRSRVRLINAKPLIKGLVNTVLTNRLARRYRSEQAS